MTLEAAGSWRCPVPLPPGYVTLGHGGGGRLMHELLRFITGHFDSDALAATTDSAVVDCDARRLAFTTDSYVVTPLFFPGGDIGKLAVCGTVNDLAMAGAVPKVLSLGLILEEGLTFDVLSRILGSVAAAALECGVKIVTGDTKVVERGRGDQVFINTSGVGWVHHPLQLTPRSITAGDALLVSGDLGRHGATIMSQRTGTSLHSELHSDVAPLHREVAALLSSGVRLRCLRDLTRGGLASAVHELASASGLSVELQESQISTCEEVQGVCEILGLDPLFLANEGRFLAVVASDDVEPALAALRSCGARPACVGAMHSAVPGVPVWTATQFGVQRVLTLFSGEQLPRIC